ncbi:MAG TPA: hypothetical protein VLI55_10600 [Bryobacteraceae bacterium]|nr:hypothetical protein [Bryobacteraceae bacterium]
MPSRTGRQIIARLLRRAFAGIVLTTALVYAIDYAVLRYRIATKDTPFGTVTVRPYYAVPEKNHKTEFLLDDPVQQTCVHSLFPQEGDTPCWYLSRHREQRIDL